MICHVANGFCVPLSTGPICRRCLQSRQPPAQMKMAPETGAIDRNTWCSSRYTARIVTREIRVVCASKPKIWEVAVADGAAAARGQKAVDRGHQAAERGAGGKEADGCSLGHGCPLSQVAEQLRAAIGRNLCIPNATDNRFVCTATIGLLHRSIMHQWHPR
jgi:hypothetical protein